MGIRILAIDVGTGTQDILLFDTGSVVENNPKMVMPSGTSIVAQRVAEATRAGRDILFTGVTMGGGPCSWAVETHLKAGRRVYATPDAARTFDDHLENVERMGVRVVSEDEAAAMGNTPAGAAIQAIEMKDVYLESIEDALRSFGVEPRYDGIAVAVFDHGAAPVDVSDRIFRFQHLRNALSGDGRLSAFAYLAGEVPPYLTRMQAVAATLAARPEAPLLLLDTAPAGALGALGDPAVAAQRERLIVNLGNMHVTAFQLEGEEVIGVFEHHTGLVDQPKVNGLLEKLVAGTLQNDEVFQDTGHGAHVFRTGEGIPFLAVTGPRRSLLKGSPLAPYFAVPYGDMMLAGCFGLVRAFGRKVPEWGEEIERALEA